MDQASLRQAGVAAEAGQNSKCIDVLVKRCLALPVKEAEEDLEEAWPYRAPNELCGVWRRNYIKRPASEGTEDSSVQVRYLQTPVAFVDVRVLKERSVWPVQPSNDEEIKNALTDRKAEGFAGVTTIIDGVIRWHACINLEPQVARGAWSDARRGLPPPTEDCGTAVPTHSDTWLEYAYPDPKTYVEEWQRVVEESKTTASWLAAINVVQNEVLVVSDDFFGYGRDQRSTLPDTTTALCTDPASVCFCSGRVSTGWIVDLSAVGFWESRRLVLGSNLSEWQILPGSTMTISELISNAGAIYPDVLWNPFTERLRFLPQPDQSQTKLLVGAPIEHMLTSRLYLRKLRSLDLDIDYEAVMEDCSALRSVFTRNDSWPADDLTKSEDLEDLRRHQAEFECDLAFAYVVYDKTKDAASQHPGDYLGCCYINPPTKQGCEAEVFLWIRPKAADHTARDAELEHALRAWLVSDPWPYKTLAFPGRDPPDVPQQEHLSFDEKWNHWENRPWLDLAYPRVCVDAQTIVLHQPRASGLIP